MGNDGKIARAIRGGAGVGRAIAGIGIASAVTLGFVGAGCGSGSNGAALSGSCTLNSDCDAPLVCVFARCHAQCQTSADCSTGSRCVSSTSPGAPGVCQLVVEATCAGGRPCDGNQVCSTSDDQCRTPCVDTATCDNGQLCVTMGTESLCYQADNVVDQTALVQAGILAPDGAVLVDTPATSTYVVDASVEGGIHDGGAPDGTLETGAPDGTIESAGPDGAIESGSTTDGAREAAAPNSCPIAQAQFGSTAQGDSNPYFTSGVGVRGANALLIFSAYQGPDPDAGLAPTSFDAGDGDEEVNLVYVQAFDVATAASLGPALPLFAAPPGDGFVVDSAAVAPTGQIALTFSYGGVLDYNTGTDRSQSALYAAFVDPSADAGPAGLAFQKDVEIESAQFTGQPHVAWAASSAAFVFSWEYLSGSWYIGSRNFLATGEAAGGSAPLPTSQPGDVTENPYSAFAVDQGAVAQGPDSLFGVAYGESGAEDWLTVFDGQGNPVGASVRVPPPTDDHYWLALGATATGFVYLYDTGGSVAEIFVPIEADAGPVPLDAGDSGVTPEYAGFTFSGAIRAVDVRALNDDTGGQGGVGAAVLYPDGLSFAYVNADGLTHLNPTSVIAHTFVAGDEINLSNFGGSFGLSIYGAATQSTQIAASGCPAP